MQQALQLWEEKPESALLLMDAVNTGRLNKVERSEYTLLRVQAKDKADRDLTHDTEIFEAKEYFIGGKDPEKAALACFYAGVVLQKQGEEAKALEHYLKAEDFAERLAFNHLLRGRIQSRMGNINYTFGLYEDALLRLAQAMEFFRVADHKNSEIRTMITMGNCYLLTYRNDSAFALYGRAEKMATSIKDTAMLLAVVQNTGVAYEVTGNHARAADGFYTALAWANQQDSAQLLLNLSDVYLNTGRIDSALMYGKKALAVMDSTAAKPMRLAAYHIMMKIAAHRGEGVDMLDYFSQYIECLDEIYDKREKESLIEVQKKYDIEKAKKEHAIEKRNYIIAILSALCATFGFLLWSLHLRRGKIRRERTIARLLLQLDELRKKEEQLQKLIETETNKHNPETDQLAKTYFTRYFRMLDTIARECRNASANQKAVEIEQLKRLLFGCSDYDFWQATEKFIPKGLIEKIKKMCPKLDDSELKICCLSCLNADTEAISIVMGIKNETLYSVKSRIRKKLGMDDKKDIRAFLEEKMSNQGFSTQ